MSGRPDRNSDWIRSVSKDIRAKLTKINIKYRQSGNQDSENKYDKWVKFSSGNSPTYSFAICLFDSSRLNNRGKAIPSDIQKIPVALLLLLHLLSSQRLQVDLTLI